MARNASRPGMDNRSRMVTTGEIDAPKPFDPQSLADTAVEGTPPPFAMEGNLDVDNPDGSDPGQPGLHPPAQDAPGTPQPPAQPQPGAPEPKQPEQPAPEDVDDPRFKGKSKKEVYESYRNLERLQGEHAQELKTYKTLYEQQVLKPQMEAAQKARNPQPEPPPPTDPSAVLNEMLTDPVKYERKMIERAKRELFNDLTQASTVAQAQQEAAANQALFQTPEFQEWEKVNLTPALVQQASTDARVVKFIVNAFKASHPTAAPAPAPVQPETSPQEPATPAPVVPSAPAPDRRIPLGNAMGAPAAGKPATPGPKFTTAQLARMQIEDPEQYARRQPEILEWYLNRGK